MNRHDQLQQSLSHWRSPIAGFIIALLSIMATGCGGGGAEASTGPNTSTNTSSSTNTEASGGNSAAAPANLTLPQAVLTLTPQLNKTFLLTSDEIATASKAQATSLTTGSKAQAAAAPSAAISATQLLNWAQSKFPSRFPGNPSTLVDGAVTYRHYPSVTTYLGVANNKVYAYGDATGKSLIDAGDLVDYTCAVSPTLCETPTVVVPKSAFSCLIGAITCVEVASTSTETQSAVPLTFGLPLAAGKWRHQTIGLTARDNQGQAVPIQADDISSHRDGSARFAVINAKLANLQAGERRIISFFPGNQSSPTPQLVAEPAWNLNLQAKVYFPQVTKITLGNRNGATDGTPFVKGETISIRLSGIADETYSVVISDATAGGGYGTLTKLAEAVMAEINAKSPNYVAYKPLSSYESLYIKARSPGLGAFTVGITYAGLAKTTQTDTSGFKTPETWVVNGQDLLKAAITKANGLQSDAARRFHGPVATEFHLAAPFKNGATGATHPFLTARLDTRLFEGGARIRTDVVIENNWAFKGNPRNIVYELNIQQNGQVVFDQPYFEHYHHARWHKVVWTQTPKTVVRHNMRDFLDSRAVQNYNLAVEVPESVLAKEASNLVAKRAAQAELGPMANAFLNPAFPTTGARADIGPLPRWTAMYLVSQDQRALEVMLANADAAGSVPIHFRDENTEQPLNTIQYPDFSTYSSSPSPLDPTMWSPDTAHQGSFSYVPYLVTGDRFYRDEAMFWASWNIFTMPAGYRGNALSLVNRHQIRGQAWGLRSIGEAYRVLPDNHPMKAPFTQILQNNIDWYKDFYVTKKLGAAMGSIQHSSTNQTPPWQDDYFSIVFAQLAENNDPNAMDVLNWFSQFTVGRFLAEDQGFCTARAPGYYWYFSTNTNVNFTTWSELFAANFPADVGLACDTLTIKEGYPTTASGAAAYARGMLGAAANAGVTNANTAYSRWKLMTPQMDLDFKNDLTWAIVPR